MHLAYARGPDAANLGDITQTVPVSQSLYRSSTISQVPRYIFVSAAPKVLLNKLLSKAEQDAACAAFPWGPLCLLGHCTIPEAQGSSVQP